MQDSIKLYTWVDVKDYLLQIREDDRWHDTVEIEVFPDGVYVNYLSEALDINKVEAWLNEIFPTGLLIDQSIQLEQLNGQVRSLPVIIEETDELQSIRPEPTFNRPRYISTKITTRNREAVNEDPVIIAAHSFKGGVGRTLHALALAVGLTKTGQDQRVLYIDADLEAPGTTWLTPEPEISTVDVLNLVHGAQPNELDAIVSTVRTELLNLAQDNIYFLPAFRNQSQFRSLEIKPEHIFRFATNPFIITDIFARIGQKLEVSHVVVDLRAGFSEISANWLLDPRVSKVFVTTLNGQSVEGTRELFRLLLQEQHEQNLLPRELPGLVVSQVDSDDQEALINIWNRTEEVDSRTSSQAISQLREAYDEYVSDLLAQEESEGDDAGEGGLLREEFLLAVSTYYKDLQTISNRWEEVKRKIEQNLLGNLRDLIGYYQISVDEPSDADPSAEDEIITLEQRRIRMHSVLPNLVFAEKDSPPDSFYRSESIRNLALRHQTRLPNVVVVGAKGSGKTFLFRQIRRAAHWQNFVHQAGGGGVNAELISAQIRAVTFPENVEQKDLIWEASIKPHLIKKLETTHNETAWRNIWLDVIAWTGGHQEGIEGVWTSFLREMAQTHENCVFLFDGLEDLFDRYDTHDAQKTALRALLRDVPSYLSVLPNNSVGFIAFIRRDIVEQIISQNSGQFLDRYKEYRLLWDRTEALRLVAWILDHYNILKIELEDLTTASEQQLIKALYPLWGLKLGSNKSREVRSFKSVLSTLANYNGEIQSRDMVRLLSEAIQIEKQNDGRYSDRILGPRAIKKAFREVGREKVSEVISENQNNAFGKALLELRQKANILKLPAEKLPLSGETTENLIDNGVLIRHNGRYYMSELFRLGFDVRSGRGKVKLF